MTRLAIAATLAVILAGCATSSGGSSSATLAGYGKSVDDVAKILGCSIIEPHESDSVARCLGADGNQAVIFTSDSADVQGLTMAMMRDVGSLNCALVLPGVVLRAYDNAELGVVLGESPAAYATEHGGRVEGCSH